MQTCPELANDPQVAAVGQLQRIDLAGGDHESALIPRLPFTLSDNPPEIAGPPPRLGEHGRDILREAGYTDRQIEELQDENLCAASARQPEIEGSTCR